MRDYKINQLLPNTSNLEVRFEGSNGDPEPILAWALIEHSDGETEVVPMIFNYGETLVPVFETDKEYSVGWGF